LAQSLLFGGGSLSGRCNFKRLHDTIQFSLDWWDRHLYKFELQQEKLRITNDEEAYEEYKFYHANIRAKH
jgi:hypothetical protein